MRHNTQNNNVSGMGRFVNQLAAERSKTIVGICLVVVMALMWVRVLTGRKAPASVKADIGPGQTATAVQSEPRTRLVFVELPGIEGRNDVLVRDFFSVNRWEALARSEKRGGSFGGEVSMIVGNGGEEYLNRETILQAAKLLRLAVIELGERPHAFINDTLLSVGEKLLVVHEGTSYEFTVVAINGNEVLLTCQGVNIEMKLLQQEQKSN
jgi:hypothetical protein